MDDSPKKKENKLVNYLKTTKVRAFLTALATIIVSILCSQFNLFEKDQDLLAKLGIIVVIVFLYAAFLLFYATIDSNNGRAIETLEAQRASLHQQLDNTERLLIKALRSWHRSFVDNAREINNASHLENKSKKELRKIWAFDKLCYSWCGLIANILEDLMEQGDQFTVSYVKLKETPDKHSNPIARMVGYYSTTGDPPTNYNKDRPVNGLEEHYRDLLIFRQRNPNLVVATTTEEVDAMLHDAHGRYAQYVAIPVLCDDNDTVAGVLQVSVRQGTILAKERKRLEEISNQYLRPFSSYLLLMHKVEKSLLASLALEGE